MAIPNYSIFQPGRLCDTLSGLAVFLAGCSPFDLLVKTFMVAGLLGVVAALRVKDKPTAINRRQADQGLTTFERDKQATWHNLSRTGKAFGGGVSQ